MHDLDPKVQYFVDRAMVQIPVPPRAASSTSTGFSPVGIIAFAALALVLVLAAIGAGTALNAARSALSTALSGLAPPPDLASGPPLETAVRRLLGNLQFRPLIPDSALIQGAANLRAACGAAQSNCLEIVWDTPTQHVVILQGPAACCLDFARPNAIRDVEVRPGVMAQFDSIEPQFGGPILWWVDHSSGDAVYVAISSPLGTRDDLVRVARSMRPLAPPGFRDGRCETGPATESARNGDFVFQTTGIVSAQNEVVFVAKRGTKLGDHVEARLSRLDASGSIGLLEATAQPGPVGQMRFAIPVFKPAGAGCWQIDVMDGTKSASYVVEVQGR
jgi:hypothetical protein